jgi:uncharacterized protein (TIGR03790 family)
VHAQDGTNVLLVVNAASPSSEPIAVRYAKARAVPPQNIVRLKTGTGDEIERAQYEREIERPIGEWLTRQAAQDRILYIVLTKGVPLRIGGSTGRNGTIASVDSELTLLYRRLVGTRVLAAGPADNPYFQGKSPAGESKPFTHAEHDIYLVSRLDGFTQADAMDLVDRGLSPRREGQFLLDAMGAAADRVADGWLQATAKALADAGFQGRVVFDSTNVALRSNSKVLGYASWGSNDPSIRTRRIGLGFVPGALATRFVSTDARTLREPPEKWQPGEANDQAAAFEGSQQSLTGDLIRDGVTGASGYVAEPFLDGTVRPNILFPAYVAGSNLIESFYLAVPHLSWTTVVFGDPLCAPFRSSGAPSEETAPDLEAETELPKYFSRRRVAYLASTGVAAEAAKLWLKGEARHRDGDAAGARRVLEQATAIAPGLTPAHRMLGGIYEALGEYDLAIERYRRVLEKMPDDLLSLNNLAYALAVYKKAPAEALPFARDAHAASKGASPSITDTLGWIQYLLGNHSEAETLLLEATAGAPDNAEIHLHLAHVYAARGRSDLAARTLDKSLRLDAKLAERDDVKALRAQLTGR